MGQPRVLKNAKILVANTAMDTDKVKIFGSRFRVESPEQLAELSGLSLEGCAPIIEFAEREAERPEREAADLARLKRYTLSYKFLTDQLGEADYRELMARHG